MSPTVALGSTAPAVWAWPSVDVSAHAASPAEHVRISSFAAVEIPASGMPASGELAKSIPASGMPASGDPSRSIPASGIAGER